MTIEIIRLSELEDKLAHQKAQEDIKRCEKKIKYHRKATNAWIRWKGHLEGKMKK